ncbi:MAG TPA: hypothetical protein V6C85_09795 [Allocoleopsis sp.]
MPQYRIGGEGSVRDWGRLQTTPTSIIDLDRELWAKKLARENRSLGWIGGSISAS